MHASPRFIAAATALALGGLAGCADTTGTAGARPVSLSFSTGGLAPATATAARYALVGTADALVITKAQLVLSKSELEREGASCAGAVVADEDNCPELKLGPMLVDLPLDATAKAVLAVTIPAGSSDKFEGKIDAVSSETDGKPADAAAFLAANPQFRGVSIRVEGTFNGQPFVFTTGVESELELSFNPALVVDGAVNNLTVRVDLSTWFHRADGTSIDPSTATTGSANKQVVDENIKRSFHVFEDDDRDGRDN